MPRIGEGRKGDGQAGRDLERHVLSKLREAIVGLSMAETWAEARSKWALDYIYFAEPDQPGICLCGHHPIIEHCVLANRLNGNRATVGNVCVTRFMGLGTAKLFQALARIRANPGAALNAEAIEYAMDKGWINKWEYDFLSQHVLQALAIGEPRNIRIKINQQILNWVAAAKAVGGRS